MDDATKNGNADPVVIVIGDTVDDEQIAAQIREAMEGGRTVFFEISGDHPILSCAVDLSAVQDSDIAAILASSEGIGTPEVRRGIMDEMEAADRRRGGMRAGIVGAGGLSGLLSLLNDDRSATTIEIGHSNLRPLREDVPVMDFGMLNDKVDLGSADKRPGHLKGEGARITKMRR